MEAKGIALMAYVLPWINNVKCYGADQPKSQTPNVSANTIHEAHRLEIVGKPSIIVISRVKWSKSNLSWHCVIYIYIYYAYLT